MYSGGVMSTYLSGGVALIRIGVVGIVPPILPSYKIKLSFLLFLEKAASIGFFCLRSLRILGGSSGFVTYPRAVHLIRSWQCYIAFAFEGYGAAFRFQFIAEAVQSGGSDFQSLIFPEMYEVEVSAFWRGHSVLLSALFHRVGFGGASGPRSEISDLLTVRFELCLGSSSRDQEFSFSHLQFVSTLLSSSIWLPWCSPTVLILSGLWVWTLRPLCSNG
ncbi:hypothetical protein F2Q69_00046788 [Brassica cretica]|uniref:Uncharacterized protein n=1 Tax=Brassica cretica TaxID=69181 RepID=A0A8S9PNS5_BRACR|nr:hypothetical protein F2Q69_00046788 [Brassica cretica]